MTRKPLYPLIKHGVSRAVMKQRTFDIQDQIAEQTHKYGPAPVETPLVKLDPAGLAAFDRMVVLEGIMKDPGCRLVSVMAKCSMEETAERILMLVDQGKMTIGMLDGQIRVGITRDGWKALSRKLNH